MFSEGIEKQQNCNGLRHGKTLTKLCNSLILSNLMYVFTQLNLVEISLSPLYFCKLVLQLLG